MLVIEKENSGLIFANDDTGNDKAPTYTGVINVNGEQWQIALWDREFESGVLGFGVKISEPREEAPKARTESRQPPSRTAPSRGDKLTPRSKPTRR